MPIMPICPECCGDGKETCNNPDHGFIGTFPFHDTGRIGCPCCGHDEFHKVKNGDNCYICSGTGKVTDAQFSDYCDEYSLDRKWHLLDVELVNNIMKKRELIPAAQ
ncbi:hypothetical protein [Xenorhabdus littoralis]|uniref:hypothetical protein n=1 Tax=Xenorhabdus littoralis TaxID=2582835 RepID=UPI0029E7F6BC|nr:hypothetical protein [Xenorhabdus sp. psl]MDX7992623.1 hypothetical protein [Xenorhabdus sp. psl]